MAYPTDAAARAASAVQAAALAPVVTATSNAAEQQVAAAATLTTAATQAHFKHFMSQQPITVTQDEALIMEMGIEMSNIAARIKSQGVKGAEMIRMVISDMCDFSTTQMDGVRAELTSEYALKRGPAIVILRHFDAMRKLYDQQMSKTDNKNASS